MTPVFVCPNGDAICVFALYIAKSYCKWRRKRANVIAKIKHQLPPNRRNTFPFDSTELKPFLYKYISHSIGNHFRFVIKPFLLLLLFPFSSLFVPTPYEITDGWSIQFNWSMQNEVCSASFKSKKKYIWNGHRVGSVWVKPYLRPSPSLTFPLNRLRRPIHSIAISYILLVINVCLVIRDDNYNRILHCVVWLQLPSRLNMSFDHCRPQQQQTNMFQCFFCHFLPIK